MIVQVGTMEAFILNEHCNVDLHSPETQKLIETTITARVVVVDVQRNKI